MIERELPFNPALFKVIIFWSTEISGSAATTSRMPLSNSIETDALFCKGFARVKLINTVINFF